MTGYFAAINEFCRDPVDGERGLVDHLMLGLLILTAPSMLPMYYLGVLGAFIPDLRRDN